MTRDDLLIPLLSFLSVIAVSGALLLLRAARRKRLRARLQALEGRADSPDPERPQVVSATARLLRPVSALGSLVPCKSPERLQKELAKAGYHGEDSIALHFGFKLILMFIGLAGLGFILRGVEVGLSLKVFLTLAGATLLSFLPNVIVRMRRQRRTAEIRFYFADVLDLLEICVSSGMGLESAWNAVTEEIRQVSKTLGDEMALTDLEIHLGASRAVALRHMAERTGAQEVSSLVATLAQSERFGTSISDALRTFATSMRELRSQRASEAAEKMAVKLLFPMVFFIFPTILIVSVGPALIAIAKLL